MHSIFVKIVFVMGLVIFCSCSKLGIEQPGNESNDTASAPAKQPPATPQTPPAPQKPPVPEEPKILENFDESLGIKYSYYNNCELKNSSVDASEEQLKLAYELGYIHADFASLETSLSCSGTQIFEAERIFVWQNQLLGKVNSNDLQQWLYNDDSTMDWKPQNLRKGVEGFWHEEQMYDGSKTSTYYLIDETRGILKLVFSKPKKITSEQAASGKILAESLVMDLQSPVITGLESMDSSVARGEDWRVKVKYEDDLPSSYCGIDSEIEEERPISSPADLSTWLGRDIVHNTNKLSSAYLPATYGYCDLVSDNEYNLKFSIPSLIQPGKLFLGGLNLEDSWGHSVKISLDPVAGTEGKLLPEYRSILGRVQNTLKSLSVNITKNRNDVNLIDRLPPQLISGKRENGDDESDLSFSLKVSDSSLFSILAMDFTLDGKDNKCLPRLGSLELYEDDDESDLYFDLDRDVCGVNGDFSRIKVKRILMVDEVGNYSELTDFSNYPDINEKTFNKLIRQRRLFGYR